MPGVIPAERHRCGPPACPPRAILRAHERNEIFARVGAAVMKAVIVGGGIGGLCAALCLHRIGWQVQVLEQASTFSEIGAGIQLSPNGCKVLAALDLMPALLPLAFRPQRLEMRMGTSGRQIFSIALDAPALTRWGAPYLHIHRADLIQVLRQTLSARAPRALLADHRVQGYEPANQGVAAVLAEDARLRGDLLIGADGIHSCIREQLAGADAPRFTGNIAWRATVPMDRLGPHCPPPSACVWAGPNRHAVTYRLRGGTLANLVGVVEQQGWETESWTEQGTRAQALADFQGWHPVITTLIKQADAHFRWALLERPALPAWSEGRVVLLGDAAHPMLPSLAQGAAMAIEDGWALSQALHQHADTHDALKAYQNARQPRTTRVQQRARANLNTFHRAGRAAQFATYAPMWLAGKLIPRTIHASQDWLYGYDITA